MTPNTTLGAIADSIPARLVLETLGDRGVEVVDLTHDSRDVGPGWAYACVVGERADGHAFAPAAVEAGATLLIVERRLDLPVAQIVVGDTRRAMGHAAAVVHGMPSQQLTVIGITGTNGKTTTAHMLGSILSDAGHTVRIRGTLSGARTTPEAPDLQRELAGYVREGVDTVVMEVSSHAMVFHRVVGTRFRVVVFTNLGRDHLDLHESMEAYFRAKASLFDPSLASAGVANVDDPYGQLLVDAAPIDTTGFSRSDATDVDVDVGHHAFTWRGVRVEVPLGGHFNVMNSLAALTTAEVLGLGAEAAAAGLARCAAVPGRFEMVTGPDDAFAVVVDYAHTPDGLEELLRSARSLVGGGRVVAVFGCAGDRDPDKRPQMGAVGARFADVPIVTSDNPRTEEPAAIVDEVVAGVDERDRGRVVVEVDRRRAIARALDTAKPGDVVVIAGKGHESTQTIGTRQIEFDDRVVARELLAERVGVSDVTGEPS